MVPTKDVSQHILVMKGNFGALANQNRHKNINSQRNHFKNFEVTDRHVLNASVMFNGWRNML